ncbi:hypothetical protein MUK42_03690 [Musa troglodytarum]|uniref:Uncharacterized protein n=1 Tax=Musa troglodytarum TaxID=320322 RepID=A0A9E7KXB2_9LILI|nr:hypothetical protein MUK42_03690 [Musa troglodytarum]
MGNRCFLVGASDGTSRMLGEEREIDVRSNASGGRRVIVSTALSALLLNAAGKAGRRRHGLSCFPSASPSPSRVLLPTSFPSLRHRLFVSRGEMARFGGWIRFLMLFLRVLMERPVPNEIQLVEDDDAPKEASLKLK